MVKINEKISQLKIELTAKETGFSKRKSKKITPTNFVKSFFGMMQKGKFSLNEWANEIYGLTSELVTHQAIAKKLGFKTKKFVDKLLTTALSNTIQTNSNFELAKHLKCFRKVLVEDSTTIKLSRQLFPFFPGSNNQHSKTNYKSIAKVQLRINIKGNVYENFDLMSFRDTDAKYTYQILDSLSPNDLVIRDLGYWKKDVLEKIEKADAYFLTRLKLANKLFYADKEGELNLYSFLKGLDKQKIKRVDMPIKLTKNGSKFRLVAIKLTKKQAVRRREMAKKNRNSKAKKIRYKTNYLLSWNLFVTNVENKIWTVDEVYETYALRWNIETIFKTWKSNFKVIELLQTCTGRNPIRPEIIFKLYLLWIVLIYQPTFNSYQAMVYKKHKRFLSPRKFASFLKTNLEFLSMAANDRIIKLLLHRCCFDKRFDRKNYFENLYMTSLG